LSSTNRINGIRWGGLAFEADIGPGWEMIAINDLAANADRLREAVTANKDGSAPIKLLLKRGDAFRTVQFDYAGGLRYPRLERIEGTRDRLTEILSPRRR
ncbi:MAG: peptidase M61, partial [Brevundimonas sp.]